MSHSKDRSRSRTTIVPLHVDRSSEGLIAGAGNPFTAYDYTLETCFDGVHKGPPYKTGGGFLLRRSKFTQGVGTSHIYYNDLPTYSSGGWVTSYFGPNAPGYMVTAHNSASSLAYHQSGQQANFTRMYSKARPGQSQANLAQTLGELHQVPRIPGLAASPPSKGIVAAYKQGTGHYVNLGSEYLNINFGWIPFLSDLLKFVKATNNMDQLLRQLARDNGRRVRRRVKVPLSGEFTPPSITTSTTGMLWPSLHAFYYQGTSVRTIIQERTRDAWMVGRFRYWIPDLGSPHQRIRSVIKLLGAAPSPSLVWELTPWSWLSDWHFNIGSILSNLSGTAAENLVCDYAYGMTHSKLRFLVQEKGSFVNGQSVQAHAEYIREIKERTIGNPYGFGVESSSYSAKQIAILGALGISRRT